MTEQSMEDDDWAAAADKYVSRQQLKAAHQGDYSAYLKAGKADEHTALANKLYDQLRALEEMAAATPALTPNAVRAKARILQSSIKTHLQKSFVADYDHALALSLVNDILADKPKS